MLKMKKRCNFFSLHADNLLRWLSSGGDSLGADSLLCWLSSIRSHCGSHRHLLLFILDEQEILS